MFKNFKYYVLLTVATVIWGTGYVTTKIALEAGYGPFYISGFRFIVSGLLLTLIQIKTIPKLTKETLYRGSLLGILLFFGFTFQTIGLFYTSISHNAFITALFVIIVPFLYWLIYKTRPSLFQFIAVFITIVGVRFITLNLEGGINIGDFLTFFCAIFFAAHMIYLGKYTQLDSPLVLTGIQTIIAGLLSWICAFAFEPVPAFSWPALLSILYLGIFSSFIAFTFQSIGQKYVSQISSSIILSSESLFGTLAGVIFLKENLTLKIIVGGLLIFLAIVLSEIKISIKKK